MILALIAGDAYGPYWGTLITASGLTLSCAILYFPAKYLGKIHIKPFLSSNLPAMWKFIRTQDYKVVFITRFIPLFPFDIFSILFGIADFRFKSVIIGTFFGSLAESYMFARLVDPSASLLTQTAKSLTMFGFIALAPLLIYEIFERKKGSSLWNRVRNMYREFVFEIRANNEIVHRQTYSKEKIPVILLYGFFSSRRSLTVLERILQARGFQVMSFNLGGLFGVFFTRGISETARFIDTKIRRQIHRHDFKKVHIVAHSKGGLVAMWWLLKLGGHRVCDKLITMGTPFKGSWLTYLAIISPLGFFWPDVWQMRPGSSFLKDLHGTTVPRSLRVHCLYSLKDRVTPGTAGLFEPTARPEGKITPIPMHHISHFEFLYRRDVGDVLTKLLLEPGSALPKVPDEPETDDIPEVRQA
jgi:triacylglycerol lipase